MTAEEKRIGADKEGGDRLLGQFCKGRINVGIRAGVDYFNMKTKASRADLQVLEIGAGAPPSSASWRNC